MQLLQILNTGATQISLGTGETVNAGGVIAVYIEAGVSNTITGGTCTLLNTFIPAPYSASVSSPYNSDGTLKVTAMSEGTGMIDIVVDGTHIPFGTMLQNVTVNNTTITV